MAVIEKRETKDGKIQYRVKVRLKGFPPQTRRILPSGVQEALQGSEQRLVAASGN